MYFKIIESGYIIGIGKNGNGAVTEISEQEYNAILDIIRNAPAAPDGYQYKLRADTLEWELVELPPAPEYEPTVEDKAEAYDILIGEGATA